MPSKGKDAMWCVVMFDLPTKTKTEVRDANKFRSFLFDIGFCRAQFSVYAQFLPHSSRMLSIVKQIKGNLPRRGEVRIVSITDSQWSKALRFTNQKGVIDDDTPQQLTIF